MASRYIPSKDSDRIAFFKTFNAGVKELGSQLGLSADDISKLGNSTQSTLDKADATQTLFTNYQVSNNEKKTMEKTHSDLIITTVTK